MTNDFIYFSQATLDTMQKVLSQADTLQQYAIDFERGATATVSVSINDTQILNRDLKSDINGSPVKMWLNQKMRDLLHCYRENLDALTTFLEQEESRQ